METATEIKIPGSSRFKPIGDLKLKLETSKWELAYWLIHCSSAFWIRILMLKHGFVQPFIAHNYISETRGTLDTPTSVCIANWLQLSASSSSLLTSIAAPAQQDRAPPISPWGCPIAPLTLPWWSYGKCANLEILLETLNLSQLTLTLAILGPRF